MARVLLVEDDKYLNKLLSDRLSLEGFEVQSVLDGETAYMELKRAEKPYDILVSDMLLPRMMGAELFSKIREERILPDLKIFAMSGIYKDRQQISEISQLHGLSGYWVKPFSIDELMSKLLDRPLQNASHSIQGRLGEIPLERLFLRAYDDGFTGELHLRHDQLLRKIYFSSGFPVGANSTSLTESLGDSLIAMKLISSEIRDEASRRMVEENLQFGQMLIKMEAITQPQLFEALRKHTYKLLLNSFLMKEGSFEWKGAKELPAYVLPLEFNPMLLILRAHRAFFSTEFLNEFYSHKREQFANLKPRAFQILPLLNLDENSLAFFHALSNKADFDSVLCAVPQPGYETLFRVLFLLENIGLLEWKLEPSLSEVASPSIVDFRRAFEEETHAVQTSQDLLKAEYMALSSKDYFQIFELKENFAVGELEEAYRNLRYRLHPDRFSGGGMSGQAKRILDDMLSRIDRAYQTLLDPEQRKKYVAGLKRTREDSASDSKSFLKAQNYFRDGQRLLANQNFTGAAIEFRKAAEAWDRGAEYTLYALFAEFKQAALEKRLNDQEGLLEKLLKYAGQHPTQDLGFLLLGHAYQTAGRVEQAKVSYQKALSINDKNDEAANALARFGQADMKKHRVARVIHSSKSRIKRYFFYGLLIVTSILVYQQRERFVFTEDGITKLEAMEFEPHFPARSGKMKGDTTKIVIKEGWLQEVPDSILLSKCVQTIAKFKSRGILRLYLFDEKTGLKAQCTHEKLQRY